MWVMLRKEEAGQVATEAAPRSHRGRRAGRNCDSLRQMVAAGASRLTSTLDGGDASREVASMIDHTLLKPKATPDQIAQLCYEARRHDFAAVCVNPTHVRLCPPTAQGHSGAGVHRGGVSPRRYAAGGQGVRDAASPR